MFVWIVSHHTMSECLLKWVWSTVLKQATVSSLGLAFFPCITDIVLFTIIWVRAHTPNHFMVIDRKKKGPIIPERACVWGFILTCQQSLRTVSRASTGDIPITLSLALSLVHRTDTHTCRRIDSRLLPTEDGAVCRGLISASPGAHYGHVPGVNPLIWRWSDVLCPLSHGSVLWW